MQLRASAPSAFNSTSSFWQTITPKKSCTQWPPNKTQQQIRAFGDANPPRHFESDGRLVLPLAYYQRPASDIAAIVRARYTHRERELSGSGSQILYFARYRSSA